MLKNTTVYPKYFSTLDIFIAERATEKNAYLEKILSKID